MQGRSSGWVLRRKGGMKLPVWGGYAAFWWYAFSTSLGSHYWCVSRRDNRAPFVSVGDGFWLCVGSSQVFLWVCIRVARNYSCEASSTRALNLLSFCFTEYVTCCITHVQVANSFWAVHWWESVKFSLFAHWIAPICQLKAHYCLVLAYVVCGLVGSLSLRLFFIVWW